MPQNRAGQAHQIGLGLPGLMGCGRAAANNVAEARFSDASSREAGETRTVLNVKSATRPLNTIAVKQAFMSFSPIANRRRNP